MLFLLLVVAANAELTMQQWNFPVMPGCEGYATACEADATCVTLDDMVHNTCFMTTLTAAAEENGIDVPTLLANMPTPTAFESGTNYAACAFMMNKAMDITAKVPYTLSSFYDCQHTNMAAAYGEVFNWNAVVGTWDALEICMDNEECVADWESTISDTSKAGVKWDDTYEPILGFEFPNMDQSSRNFCFILLRVLATANTDLLYFGNAFFALNMENGGEIVDECNAFMNNKVMIMICVIAASTFVLTLIGVCAYTYFCKSNKDQ